MEIKRRIVKEVWIGLGLTLISTFFFLECNKMSPAAARYPKFILGILLALSAGLLIQGIYYSLRPDKNAYSGQSVKLSVIKFPMLVMALIIGYLVLFNYTNFFVATAVFVPLMMLLYGERRILRILIVTVSLELFVYLVFMKLLNVYFPL